MDICSVELCSGCSLCADACPRSAVKMEKDSEGFLRPAVNNDLCVECGICAKVCPVNKRAEKEEGEISVLAAYSKDKSISRKSSSAGVFHYLARAVLEKGGVVFGAGYDGVRVVHKGIERPEDLPDLMGSKYVQSDTSGVYNKVKAFLKEGRQVLFAGTPCQCAAVRSYIGDNELLFVMDIICHGVPSPELWNKYITEEFKDVKSVSFRHKKRGWEEYSMNIESKGGTYSRSFYSDPYLRTFVMNVALRPSCYSCSWKGENYFSDITVGDFWGIEKIYPQMYDSCGTSAVIIRSEKGEKLFSEIRDELVLHPANLRDVERANVSYRKSTRRPPIRDTFFVSMAEGKSFMELYAKHVAKIKKSTVIKKRIKITANRVLSSIYRLKSK